MSFSSGTFTLVAGNPVVTGTTITSTWANNTLNDLASGLSTCVLKDGTQTTTASVPFVFGIAVTTGITTPSTTFALANTTATTVNMLGAATAVNAGTAGCVWTMAGSFGVTWSSNSSNTAMSLVNSAATNTNQYGFAATLSGDPNDTTRYFFSGIGNVTTRINILSNGNLVNTNNSYGAISDRKLKQDIVASDSQWDDVKALGKIISKFAFKNDPNRRLLGWVAQDVQEISPGLVFSSDDTERYQDGVDDDGKPIYRIRELGTQTLGIHYSVAYMKAFKALGEALERIEALEKAIP